MIKKILIIIAAVVLTLFVMGQLVTNAQTLPQTCPDGSYDIGAGKDGELICKLEPTGCPYGDSIPLGPDCDKHAPVEVIPTTPEVLAEVDEVVDIPEIEMTGK